MSSLVFFVRKKRKLKLFLLTEEISSFFWQGGSIVFGQNYYCCLNRFESSHGIQGSDRGGAWRPRGNEALLFPVAFVFSDVEDLHSGTSHRKTMIAY